MSGTESPISPPVVPAKITIAFCSSNTATSVTSPKYGPRRRSAGIASSSPPSTAATVPNATQAGSGQPRSASAMPAP
jgi:hypothetical protein